MSDFLDTMAALSAERAATADPGLRGADFARPVLPLKLDGFDIIAEIKDRSPSEGLLAGADRDRCDQSRYYVEGGAAAISVLTEPSHFGGSLEHLQQVVAAVPETPIMRKDFLVDPIQILEARAAGASGVLLIVTMLDDQQLQDMLSCAWEHHMFVLLESFDKNDLARTRNLLAQPGHGDRADAGQLLVGVNTRNLRSLHVDSGRLETLAAELPEARCVAESGLRSAEDAARVAAWGYRLALVGSALMRSADPAELVASMRRAGCTGMVT